MFVPIRHWICNFPWGVHAVLGYDKKLRQQVTQAFARELSRSLKHRAKKLPALVSVDEALTGMVGVVQRTDSALPADDDGAAPSNGGQSVGRVKDAGCRS